MSPNVSRRLEHHLAALTTATAGALGATDRADAAIVYSGIVNITIPATASGVYLNIVQGTYSALGASTPGWDVSAFGTTSLDWYRPGGLPNGAYVGSGSTYTNLPSMTLIDASSTLGNNAGGIVTPDGTLTLNSQNNLIGFRFYNESVSTYHFGWLRVALGSTLNAPRSIVEYAWESVGGILTPFVGGNEPVGIRAGEIPAPPAAFALALFPVFFPTRRRQR